MAPQPTPNRPCSARKTPSLFTLDLICLWCSSVHVITFLLVTPVVAAATAGSPGWRDRAARAAGPSRRQRRGGVARRLAQSIMTSMQPMAMLIAIL